MKTTFSRMFSVFAVVILLCLLLFGLSSRVMLTSLLVLRARVVSYFVRKSEVAA